jgi:uncharacterized protein involved in exopolysaccharide biosynthesis
MENSALYNTSHNNEVEDWLKQADELVAEMKIIQAESQKLKLREENVKNEIQELAMRLAEKQAEEVELNTKLQDSDRQFQEKKELLKILVEL